MPSRWESAIAPYLVYQPQSAAAPDAFGYDVVDGHALLVRCRYLGRDYSGRQGNFFGHAVVATPDELEGLRPIELWGSPVWDAGDAAAELDELVPGEVFNPDALGRWFGSTGAYTLLAAVLDAVVTTLRRGHGRIVLVGENVETVARWIALVSYSLPEPVAVRLSFLTYSADPESAPYRLVGTVPEVWESLHSPHSTAFHLDHPHSHDAGRVEGFGSVAAGCWRALDLDGLDTIGELAQRITARDGTDVFEALEVAACAVSVERDVEEPDLGDSGLEAVARAVAACLAVGRPIPTARVAEAVASRVRWGDGDLMGALIAIPAEGREPVVHGALAGLERAAEDVRLKMLSDPTCDLLYDHAGHLDWLDTPAAALAVLASVGRRRPGERLAITRTLVALADLPDRAGPVTAALAEVWSGSSDDHPGGSGWSGLRARLRGGREG
jgi:hypothetical protein